MPDRTPPWERTAEFPPPATPSGAAYHRGVARVGPAPARPSHLEHEPHDRTWHDSPDLVPPRAPLGYRARQLRRGGEWTLLGGLFAFACWGLWAISVRGGDLFVPVAAFVLVLLVAVGVFALCRLLGRMVLERALHRVRRSAWGAHLVTGLFLGGAGFAYLRQTQWVVDAWSWLRGFG